LLEAQENEHVEDINSLQLQVTDQEKAIALLEEQLAQMPSATPAAPAVNTAKASPAPVNDELKKAKVDVALIGVKLKKLQKQLIETPNDQELKDKINAFETDLKAAQDTVSRLSATTESHTAASEPKAAASDELKKLKIDAAIAKAAVKKVEKALKKAEEINAPEIEAIRQQLKEAQQRADDLEKALANPEAASQNAEAQTKKADAAPNNVDADAAKKRKIDLAIAKAGIKKAEKNIQLLQEQGKDEAEINASEWPSKLKEAQEKLAALEAEENTPATAVSAPVEKIADTVAQSEVKAEPEMDLATQIKKEKIAVALAKAQINKLNKRLESTPEDANSINQEINATQQRLQRAEALLEKLIHSQTNMQENR